MKRVTNPKRFWMNLGTIQTKILTGTPISRISKNLLSSDLDGSGCALYAISKSTCWQQTP